MSCWHTTKTFHEHHSLGSHHLLCSNTFGILVMYKSNNNWQSNGLQVLFACNHVIYDSFYGEFRALNRFQPLQQYLYTVKEKLNLFLLLKPFKSKLGYTGSVRSTQLHKHDEELQDNLSENSTYDDADIRLAKLHPAQI
jgi:hypothetical protein